MSNIFIASLSLALFPLSLMLLWRQNAGAAYTNVEYTLQLFFHSLSSPSLMLLCLRNMAAADRLIITQVFTSSGRTAAPCCSIPTTSRCLHHIHAPFRTTSYCVPTVTNTAFTTLAELTSRPPAPSCTPEERRSWQAAACPAGWRRHCGRAPGPRRPRARPSPSLATPSHQ